MRSLNHWKSIVSLVVLSCLLAVPVSALGKKGKDHFNRGMKYEQAQQWEKAAQEFTLAFAADPSNVDYQLHYRRAVFNASQMFMTQGRSLAEQRDYVGAYNAFRQAFGYDPVNQLAVSEMERMLRLEEVKQGKPPTTNGDGANGRPSDVEAGGTPASPPQTKTPEAEFTPKPEPARVINYSGDLKAFIRNTPRSLTSTSYSIGRHSQPLVRSTFTCAMSLWQRLSTISSCRKVCSFRSSIGAPSWWPISRVARNTSNS